MLQLMNILAALNDPCNPNDSAGNFLNFPHWFQYLDGKEDAFGKCIPQVDFTNPSNVWSVALAGIDIMLHVAGIVAVGFIIYAGFMYMTSNGDPERTKGAKDTILNALIGLIITIIAASVVSFIGNSFK